VDLATETPTLSAPLSNSFTFSARNRFLHAAGSGHGRDSEGEFQQWDGSYHPLSGLEAAGAHTVNIDATAKLTPHGAYTVTLSYQDLVLNAPASASATNVQLRPPNPVTTPG